MNEYVKPSLEILDIELEQSILTGSTLGINNDDANSDYDQL